MDKTAETLIDVSGFISEYSAHMMGCGVHTSRVIRSMVVELVQNV